MTLHEDASDQLARNLDSLFRGVLPAQWVQPAVDAVLSDASPMVTPRDHHAAVRREIDWQHHWMQKCQAAEIEASKLRQALDVSALDRARAALHLTAGMRPSKAAKHDDTCHERHAACLAARVRAALLGSDGN